MNLNHALLFPYYYKTQKQLVILCSELVEIPVEKYDY